MRASLKGRAETGGVHLPEPALEQFHTAYKAAIDMLNKTLFFDGTSTKHGYRNIMSLSMGIADDVTLLDNSDVICGKTAPAGDGRLHPADDKGIDIKAADSDQVRCHRPNHVPSRVFEQLSVRSKISKTGSHSSRIESIEGLKGLACLTGPKERGKEEKREGRGFLHSNGQHCVPAHCAGENRPFGCAGTHFDTLRGAVPAQPVSQ